MIKNKLKNQILDRIKNIFILFFFIFFSKIYPQNEISIKYIGADHTSNSNYHDGQLSPAVGTKNFQILRANRSYPDLSDNIGWTYNHAPMLAYWRGFFWCQYLSTPMGEHSDPGITFLVKSRDGINWEKPKVIFPIYFFYEKSEKYVDVKNQIMHQRMGFYVAPNGKFLVFGHYGGNDGNGVGRVVREIKKDFTFGPIYFVRINETWEGNISYPMINSSNDKKLIEACNSFLNDPVRRIQWWEEDYLSEDSKKFYLPYERQKAFSFYSISDSTKIGLFKSRMTTYSLDGGKTWKEPRKSETLKYGGAKIWGQKLENNQFALVYNPTNNKNRHPLAVATSKDGINFNELAVIHGEVPIKRYWGIEKRPGPQYVRGIIEGNGNPPGDDLWVVYSVNKEDIWISKIPIPITRSFTGEINDSFDNNSADMALRYWNIYSPKWCPVKIKKNPLKSGYSLCLTDRDPYDYAKAVRMIDPKKRELSFDIMVKDLNNEEFYIDINNKIGRAIISLNFKKNGQVDLKTSSNKLIKQFFISKNEWNSFKIKFNLKLYIVEVNSGDFNKKIKIDFLENLYPNRIEFRTGKYRMKRKIQEYKSGDQKLPGFDEPDSETIIDPTKIYLDNFISK